MDAYAVSSMRTGLLGERLSEGCLVCGGPLLNAYVCPAGQHFSCGLCFLNHCLASRSRAAPSCPACRATGPWKTAYFLENFYGPIQCVLCARPLPTAQDFKEHVFALHRQQIPETTACYICERGLRAVTWDQLHHHVLQHVMCNLFTHQDYLERMEATTAELSSSEDSVIPAESLLGNDDETLTMTPPPDEYPLFEEDDDTFDEIQFVHTPTIYLSPLAVGGVELCESEHNPLM